MCFAEKKVTSIVRYSEPASGPGVTLSEVTYTYSLSNVAGWANDPAVRSAYHFEKQLSRSQEARIGLMLMSDGWRPATIDSR
jgi:hypothetical protein